ncbi:MAG: EF-P beta-lysylation protein EpmB [Planctomycetota bacterium]|nr:EF-P beta-lysylation protein EpmB [Planctomycetota bacterium]
MHDRTELATARPQAIDGLSWKQSLRSAVRHVDELADLLDLSESWRSSARRAARLFPLLVPRDYIARMRPGDPDDPLLRQVLPIDLEERDVPGYRADPVGDLPALRAPGLIQKYRGRALLVVSGLCAVNCRYCFRRHYPYEETPQGVAAWEPAMRELEGDGSIREVILSGGDPLVLTDETLSRLVRRLEEIPSLRRLRIHTRLPIVIPDRVDTRLLDWLTRTRLTPWVVVHANHPRELSGRCGEALGRLVDAGVPVLNQSVLLRGVNDDARVLAELCERLADLRVVPYYLHQLDPVAGAAHFHVPESRGLEILAELHRELPGYAVPRYVRETEAMAHKVEIR